MPDLTDWTELGQGLTHRVNRTDLVPSNFRHNYTGGTPQLLRARMTMGITSDDDVNMPYLAMNIKTERNMHMQLNAKGAPTENIPGPAQGINQYMQIETNSTGPMNATLRYYMNMTQLELELGSGFNMSRMTWCYWNNTDWEPVNSSLSDENVLDADTDHFSTWAIIQVEETTEPGNTSTGIPMPTAFIAIGIAVAIILRKDSLGITH